MRVVIAEDLFLLRDGLTRMLQAHGLEISAAVDNGADLLAAVTADRPDVAIVDVRLPPTFTDEGIRAALAARKTTPGLPVLVLSQYVEQLYARELLANVSKHADADQVWIDIRHDRGLLRAGVTDDGRGGADPARGTGLHGIERRLAAFDGVLAVSSPPGGPTVVNMEVPCALSSPKTSSC